MDNRELVLGSSDRNFSCLSSSEHFQNIKYVSSSKQWEAMFANIALLYPGMTLSELQSTMAEIYGFKASTNQYKKKLSEWQKQKRLPAKHRRKQLLESGKNVVIDAKGTFVKIIPAIPLYTGNVDLLNVASNAGLIACGQTTSTASQLLIQSSVQCLEALRDEEHCDTPIPIPNSQVVSKAQTNFKELIQDLWESYFDAVVDADGYITIGQAVRAVATFIIDLMATDTLAETPEEALQSISSPQDIKLMQKALWLAQVAFGDLSQMISGTDETTLSPLIKVGHRLETLADHPLTSKQAGFAFNFYTKECFWSAHLLCSANVMTALFFNP